MRHVVWSDDALADLDAQLRYIAKHSPRAALAIANRIDETGTRLGDFATGRPGRVAGSYEKVVSRTDYILVYALSDSQVTILRIIHGSRDWPEGEWPAE